jgi:chromosome partitioning protein
LRIQFRDDAARLGRTRFRKSCMSVIAVVNRKGGSGKSTLATHIAAYCALRGDAVALGDIDRQQSTRTWLRQRKVRLPGEETRIAGWHVDPRSFVRPPANIDHVVMDTPGGLTGLDLARVVMYADAIVVPVGGSIFDRESAAACLAELRTLPRVTAGRCRVAAIGMRVDAGTEACDALREWAEQQQLPLVAILPQSTAYVRCIDRGLTLFDLSPDQVDDDLAHWKPLVQWLRPLVRPAANAGDAISGNAVRPAAKEAAPIDDQPVPQRSDTRLEAVGSIAAAVVPASAPSRSEASTSIGRLLDSLPVPRFLQRRL